MTVALEAIELSKSYGPRLVVNDVSLRIHPGEIVGLLGPNGAGKTTTFQIMLGVIRKHGGTVTFGGPLDGLPLHERARRGLGYLPQGPSVFRGLKVRDNLYALARVLRLSDPAGRADALLARFDLEHLADSRARDLSGGERRRLELARALVNEPRIILADEPFAGVDPLSRQQIAASFDALRRSGVGIVLTDHSVRDALDICDRIALLVAGEIIEEGTPAELADSPIARRLYLGDSLLSNAR